MGRFCLLVELHWERSAPACSLRSRLVLYLLDCMWPNRHLGNMVRTEFLKFSLFTFGRLLLQMFTFINFIPSIFTFSIRQTECTSLHCTSLHCTAPHCTALHFPALPCTALHCTSLHCTALLTWIYGAWEGTLAACEYPEDEVCHAEGEAEDGVAAEQGQQQTDYTGACEYSRVYSTVLAQY